MTTLVELDGSEWSGTAELWVDPLGDNVVTSDCTLSLSGEQVQYTWSHEGKKHEGAISLGKDGAERCIGMALRQNEPVAPGPIGLGGADIHMVEIERHQQVGRRQGATHMTRAGRMQGAPDIAPQAPGLVAQTLKPCFPVAEHRDLSFRSLAPWLLGSSAQ